MSKLEKRLGHIAAVATILFFSLSAGRAVGQIDDVEVDWAEFLGPGRNSISNETRILKDWTNGNLKLNWTLEVDEGYAIGSVANGKYFHFDVTENVPQESKARNNQGKPGSGSKQRANGNVARLRCIDLENAKQVWEFTAPSSYRDLYGYDSGPRTSPLIHDDEVYLYGVEGMLWCLDAENGDLLWEINTIEKFGVIQNFFGVSSSPVIHDDLLLVMVGGSPEESKQAPVGMLNLVKPNGCAIVAFDRHTGKEVYRAGNDLASYSSLRIVEMHGQTIALAWMRESLLGFQPEDGNILFSFKWRARKLESVNASTPVVSENRIFLGEAYQKGGVLLDVAKDWTTKIVWTDDGRRDKSMAPHWNTPVLHKGFLYGSSGERLPNAKLSCVDFETGEVKWSVPGLGRSSVTYCDDHLIVMAEGGMLFLAKASENGFQRVTMYDGDVKFRSPCWSAPIVVDGKLIVRGKNKVACFQLVEK